MAMFNSYVSLPEGRSCYVSTVVFSKDLFFDRSRQVKSWVRNKFSLLGAIHELLELLMNPHGRQQKTYDILILGGLYNYY